MNLTKTKIFQRFQSSREAQNAAWIIGGRVVQMLLSFVVGVISARYLGPGNYGLINYGTAFVTFFTSLCTLGINSVIIKEFFEAPDAQGEVIGTTLLLRLIASVCSNLMIVGIVSVLDHGEQQTIVVSALCGLALVFFVFDTFQYWFQSRYQSKVSAIAGMIAYAATSGYKVVLLVSGKSVEWFAFATAFDAMVVAILLYWFYRRANGPRLQVSLSRGKRLLKQSYHYILSGTMIAIYGQTDKLMLKQMLDERSVGYYSLATTINYLWVFILQAIIDSMYPTILAASQKNREEFERRNRQLYAIIIYISILVAFLFVFFGEFAICLLYGEGYRPAAVPLRIVTWYTIFSYLGVARNVWIVSENKQLNRIKLMLSTAQKNLKK